ncbi:ABC transporter permease [Citricoccus sp. K5]|uniref:ABC transporter permease n=1 Tax=Citricoccus sp. K5 TaxID=2653135 RepID=UPI0012EFA869|nr:ABC transporter permease [Citricoccus sp. K5]VXB53451.1 ABC-2 type transport system permease protein [Citricoccus sp. K5]
MSSDPESHVRPARTGTALLVSELGLLFRRRRTWTLLAALAAVPVLMGVVVRVTSGPPQGRGPAFLDQVAASGLFLAVAAVMVCMPFFLPLTVAVVAGDSIAGEAAHGTLRYLLVAPVRRAGLLAVKYAAALVFCLAAALVVAAVGVLTGLALFGTGPLVLPSGMTITSAETLGRIGLMVLYATVSLSGLGALALFVSTLTDVPVGAMAAAVVLTIVAQILGALPQLAWLHPWLFTHHWMGFADLLRAPLLWDSFRENALLQVGYVAVFGALAYGRFTTKDVLS